MKAEHRHELETNQLARTLKRWGEKIEPHVTTILTVLAVGLGLYAVASLWSSYGASQDQAAWNEYEMAMLEGDIDLKQLERVASSEEHAGGKMQEWAYVGWADRQLRLAADQYFRDRDAAQERLTAIAAIYEQFADDAADEEIRNRARLGIARVSEMQNRLDDARKQYARVEGPLSVVAEARLKELEQQGVKETYQWLATADLPAPARGGSASGQRPAFEAQPPDADAPAGDAGKSLEQLLQELGGSGSAADRYGEGDGPKGEPDRTPSATDPAAPSPESEPPASTADEATAPGEESAESNDPAESSTEAGASDAKAPSNEPAEPATDPVAEDAPPAQQ